MTLDALRVGAYYLGGERSHGQPAQFGSLSRWSGVAVFRGCSRLAHDFRLIGGREDFLD